MYVSNAFALTEFASLPDGTAVLAIFQDLHAYISPSWHLTKASTGARRCLRGIT
ncbi:FMN-binding negative transcriptional regulator [Pollutimonas bauzanensis]|uniref:FMN-binding negative transcriptional regulator n=1 Tax=Pollutimonas bauzanensis TaxID=658167 RepID=UPI0033424D69